MNTLARLAATFLLLFCSATGHALDKVTFLTNWYAQAEHGGFYQAVAEGIYEKQGLDVKIGMGGPQVNVYQLLLAEKADFVMGYDVATINAVEQNLPLITVAANFQSEPVGLIAHPDVQRIEDLKTRTLLIGQASETTYWPWLKAKYGFTEAQKRPYAYSVQQFLVDKNVPATRVCRCREACSLRCRPCAKQVPQARSRHIHPTGVRLSSSVTEVDRYGLDPRSLVGVTIWPGTTALPIVPTGHRHRWRPQGDLQSESMAAGVRNSPFAIGLRLGPLSR